MNIIKGVLLAYCVLLFHVLLLFVVVLSIFLFRGLIDYISWILSGCLIIFCFLGWFFYKWVKAGKDMTSLVFDDFVDNDDRSMEMSFLWGMISFKLKLGNFLHRCRKNGVIERLSRTDRSKLSKIRKIGGLIGLLNSKLITADEYNRVKKEILKM